MGGSASEDTTQQIGLTAAAVKLRGRAHAGMSEWGGGTGAQGRARDCDRGVQQLCSASARERRRTPGVGRFRPAGAAGGRLRVHLMCLFDIAVGRRCTRAPGHTDTARYRSSGSRSTPGVSGPVLPLGVCSLRDRKPCPATTRCTPTIPRVHLHSFTQLYIVPRTGVFTTCTGLNTGGHPTQSLCAHGGVPI